MTAIAVKKEKKIKKFQKPTNQNGPRLKDRVIAYSVMVEMANPNGEVDTGGPRITSTGHNIMSPFSVKRKIRDLILRGDSDPWISDIAKGVESSRRQVYESDARGYIEMKPYDAAKAALVEARDDPASFLNRYIDVRLFGALAISDMKDEDNCSFNSKYEGCVQVAFPKSISPVTPYISSHGKKCPVDQSNSDKDGTGTLAPDGIKVDEHAVLFGHIIVNGHQAGENGATDADIDFLERMIPHLFDDRSAQRVGVHVISALSVQPDNRVYFPSNQFHIIQSMRPSLKDGVSFPKSYDDYEFPTADSVAKAFNGVKVVDLTV